MAKIYSKKNMLPKIVEPKSETISFLLNYSKALNVIKLKTMRFEVISN